MRPDHGLAFLQQYENVAWYENGAVRMLDRRVYPAKTQFVTCTTHLEVALAIKNMVTQSFGPYHAAAMGMALAAHEARGKKGAELRAYLAEAAATIANARPTTKRKMMVVTDDCLAAADLAIAAGENVVETIRARALRQMDEQYARNERIGRFLAAKLPDGGTVMTQCYAETDLGMTLRACREMGKEIKLICPETRPYFQGARLTASVALDMGFDVTVITDNMPGYVLGKKHVDVFTSASDVISMDGYIVNKIGTFQIALAAWYHQIPYYVTGLPVMEHPTKESLCIEERNPDEVLQALGQPTVKEGVKGYYPAFDITPPNLCQGVVTDKGIFAPYNLSTYFDSCPGNDVPPPPGTGCSYAPEQYGAGTAA